MDAFRDVARPPPPPDAPPFDRARDGFDVYVDCARFLPDNVTISKVVLKVLTPNFKPLGTVVEAVTSLDSPLLSPTFDCHARFLPQAQTPSSQDDGAASSDARPNGHLTSVASHYTMAAVGGASLAAGGAGQPPTNSSGLHVVRIPTPIDPAGTTCKILIVGCL